MREHGLDGEAMTFILILAKIVNKILQLRLSILPRLPVDLLVLGLRRLFLFLLDVLSVVARVGVSAGARALHSTLCVAPKSLTLLLE